MRTATAHRQRAGRRVSSSRSGYATIVTLALAVLMVMFVISGQRTLHRMKQEVRLLEERQLQHWSGGTVTNRAALGVRQTESEGGK